MVQTLIEIFYDTDSNGELILAGDPNRTAYEAVKPHLSAVEHNMNNGISSTLYTVADSADPTDVQTLVETNSYHFDHGIDGGIERGLEIQPGTPTSQEVSDLNARVQEAGGPDLSVGQPSFEPAVHVFTDLPDDALDSTTPSWANSGAKGAGGGPVPSNEAPAKNFVDTMNTDFPSIGEGNWRCVHPDHSSPEIVPLGEESSLGFDEDGDYAQRHRAPFDPTGFL